LKTKDHRSTGRTVNALVLCAGSREFDSQRPAKSYTALQTVRHRFNISASSCVAMAYDAEMGTANSLHASV